MNYRWRKSSCKGKNDPHTDTRAGLIESLLDFWSRMPAGLVRSVGYPMFVVVEHSKVVLPVICLLEVSYSAVHIIHQLPIIGE